RSAGWTRRETRRPGLRWIACQTFRPLAGARYARPAHDRRTAMAAGERAVLDPQDLDQMLRDGEVDTVLCAVPDLWGRLVGKRVTARTFRRVLDDGGGLNAS